MVMLSDGLTKRGARCKKSRGGPLFSVQGKAISKKRLLSYGELFLVYENKGISKKKSST